MLKKLVAISALSVLLVACEKTTVTTVTDAVDRAANLPAGFKMRGHVNTGGLRIRAAGTSIATAVATDTPTAAYTATSIPPTDTPTPGPTIVPADATNTAIAVMTATASVPTLTSVEATNTAIAVMTATASVPTLTSVEATNTAIAVATMTAAVPSPTPTATATWTPPIDPISGTRFEDTGLAGAYVCVKNTGIGVTDGCTPAVAPNLPADRPLLNGPVTYINGTAHMTIDTVNLKAYMKPEAADVLDLAVDGSIYSMGALGFQSVTDTVADCGVGMPCRFAVASIGGDFGVNFYVRTGTAFTTLLAWLGDAEMLFPGMAFDPQGCLSAAPGNPAAPTANPNCTTSALPVFATSVAGATPIPALNWYLFTTAAAGTVFVADLNGLPIGAPIDFSVMNPPAAAGTAKWNDMFSLTATVPAGWNRSLGTLYSIGPTVTLYQFDPAIMTTTNQALVCSLVAAAKLPKPAGCP